MSSAVWIIGSAWPYVNYIPHLGNMVGSSLSADVFVRYLRLKGEKVIFVSGSDVHGTPIEVEARKLGVDPHEYVEIMHRIVVDLFKKWNISYDNYTTTESKTHISFVQKFFMKLYERGLIFEKEDILPYCPKDRIFLPDRFIVGTCPYCGYESARGDQCERCGSLLEPRQLINPRCAVCGSTPEWRKTKHWYLDLKKLEDGVREYLMSNDRLPENVKTMSLSIIKSGLKARSVTRDNKWGIPAPFPGAENKTIYVWFEAILGYISATLEFFELSNRDPEEGLKLWKDTNTRVVFFIGKDNIPFHAIILPALLIGSGENYVLPYTISATEYLMYEGKKFSKSQKIGIWIDEALRIFDSVDYWRFILIYIRPETRDSNFSWDMAIDIVNSIINDIIGNFIHRVLTLVKRRLNGITPRITKLEECDKNILNDALQIVHDVDKLYGNIRLRDALHRCVDIARLGNKYFNERRPWDILKSDSELGASILGVGLHLVKMLAICLYPVMPESMEKLWKMMGYKCSILDRGWNDVERPVDPGLSIGEVAPLFRKVTREDINKRLKELERDRSIRWSRRYPWEQIAI